MPRFDEEIKNKFIRPASSGSFLMSAEMEKSTSEQQAQADRLELERILAGTNPKNSPSGKRLWIIFLVSLLLIGGLLIAFNSSSKFKDANYWWEVLNPKISQFLGSKLECKSVKWCGNLRICAQFCQTQDKKVLIEKVELWPDRGRIVISDWALKSLPSMLSQSKAFPPIPLPLSSIELKQGNLSIISDKLPSFDRLKLTRTSPFGQHWAVQGSLQDDAVSITGSTGDSSNLKLLLRKLTLNSGGFQSLLSGEIKLKNSSFKKKPLKVELHKLVLENVNVKGSKLAKINLDVKFSLDPLWKKLVELKSFDLESNGIHVYKNKKANTKFSLGNTFNLSPSELILASTPANKFQALLPLIKIPLTGSIQKAQGIVSGKVVVNLEHLNESKYFLKLKSLSLIFFSPSSSQFLLGPLNSNLVFNAKELLELDLDFNKFSLLPLQSYLKESNFLIQSGLLSGQLHYNKQKALMKGDFKLEDLSLFSRNYALKLWKGNGNFSLNQNKLIGEVQSQVNDSSNELKTKLNYDLLANAGIVDFTAGILNLKGLHFLDQNLTLDGDIKNFGASLSIGQKSIVLQKIFFEPLSLLIKDGRLSGKSFTLSQGKLELLLQNKLNVSNLQILLSADEKLFMDGSLYLKEQSSSKDNKFYIKGKAKLTTLTEIFEAIGYKPKWLNDIQQENGYLMGEVQIFNSKLKNLRLAFDDIGASYNGIKIDNANGKIDLDEKGNFNINELNLNYGSHSDLTLNGSFKAPKGFPFVSLDGVSIPSTNDLLKSLSSFDGLIKGNIHLVDFIDNSTQNKFKFQLSEKANLPISLEIKPTENNNVNFSFDSEFSSIGSINSDWVVSTVDNSPGYLKAKGELNLKENSFDLNALEFLVNGFNLTAEAKGNLNDFDFRAYTDPILNLGKLFKSVKGVPLKGSVSGWVEGKNISLFDKQTLWKNVKMLIRTEDLQSVSIGPAEFSSMEGYFESKDGKGFSTLVVQKGKLKNLIFEELNGSFMLEGNKLEIPGVSLNVANGDAVIKGELDLLSGEGLFKGEATKLEVGKLARGLAGQRGLSGRGDFTFTAQGHLWSLIQGERPVFGSGTFNLKNGNTSQVLNLQKKLNLANFVFGGPLALNFNSFLEVLSPTERGFYKLLQGNWQIDKDWIVIPEASYRGVNELNLNMSGLFNRKDNQINFNFIGSIPRIPVRVSSNGQTSDALNIVSQMNPINILGQLPLLGSIFDTRPRVFKFGMKGNVNDQFSLNESSARTFNWMDSALYKNLPMPNPPRKNLKLD